MFKENGSLDFSLNKTVLFKSRFDLQNKVSGLREQRIRNYQKQFNCTREYAVRYVDFKNYQWGHYAIQATAGVLYMAIARKATLGLAKTHGFLTKNYNYYPILGGSFYIGWKMYDKLRGFYLNFDSNESTLHWYTDYAEKFKVKNVEELINWEDDLSLTPMDCLYKELNENMKRLKLQNDNLVFKRQSKDKDDLNYIAGKVRNLENIAFLSNEDLKDIDSPIKLQAKLDSVTPENNFSGKSLTELIDNFHKNLESYKLSVENSKKFRSDKEKLLGLPFMMNRLQQRPEPHVGTWQYDVFKNLYGYEYDQGRGVPETEEKINRYNYHKFLHPSVIEKYDPDSEEFEMFLREQHYKSKTKREICEEQREYFCTKYMPLLNRVNDPSLGYDIVNYVENKARHSKVQRYIDETYSGSNDQKLFRTTEEMRFRNKNVSNVLNIEYSKIDKQSIGVRPEQLKQLLTNPQKKREMVSALQQSYPSYLQQTPLDEIKESRERYSLNKTWDALGVDLDKEEDLDIRKMLGLQYDAHKTDEDEVLNATHANFPHGPLTTNHPHKKYPINFFFYDCNIDMNDYHSDFPRNGVVSPKNQRFQNYRDLINRNVMNLFERRYANPRFVDYNITIIPELDKNNEEKAEKIRKRSNREKYIKELETTSEENTIKNFLEEQLDADTAQVTDDELDQALFEATYVKPAKDTEAYQKLKGKNYYELENIFKIVDFDAVEHWGDPVNFATADNTIQYTDKVQFHDPLYHIFSEVEQPYVMRSVLKKWRSGAEIRFRMPYYPDIKEVRNEVRI